MNISIIVFAGPNVTSIRLDHVCDHIVNQSVLVPQFLGFKLLLVLFLINFLESVLESSVVLLQNGVFGGQVERVFSLESKLEATVSESFNTLISVVHSHTNSSLSCELMDFHLFLTSVVSLEGDLKGSRLVNNKVSGSVLISMGVSANNDWLFPARDESGDVADDNGFSEDGAIEDVSDGSIGTLPHFLELELLNSGLIRGDGGTLDPDLALLDGLSSLNGDFVISGISVLHPEIEVHDLKVKEGQDKFILDGLPDDSGHLITIELSHWVGNFDFSSLHKILVVNRYVIRYAKIEYITIFQ